MHQVELGVLGPVRARVAGREIAFTAQRRALLAALLLEPGRVCSVDRLVDELWGELPPASPAGRVRTLVADVRKAFGTAGAKLIVTHASGYLLDGRRANLDTDAFAALSADADRARGAGRADDALDLVEAALARWRGDPFTELRGARAAAEAARLQEARRMAAETRAEILLDLGRHLEVVAEMSRMVVEHPLCERPHALLMRALQGGGRRADALAVYSAVRHRFAEELGIELSAELHELHQNVLTGAPAPQQHKPPRPPRQPEPSRRTRPWHPICLLPADVADFIGRAAEQERVTAMLHDAKSAPAVAAVHGLPGVGKTALTLHVAHRLRPFFPHGQLFARLHGSSAAPKDPADVLEELLRALGVSGADIPDSAEDRAAVYRRLVADRAVLVVLDDARDEGQVEPLLPGTPGCAVLISSRGPLCGLEGARPFRLDLPSEAEARELLGSLAGRRRVGAEPGAVQEILRACGRLPRAVRIAGARLALRPSWRLAGLAARLNGAGSRLDELVAGRLELRSGFAAGYAALTGPSRRAFRLIGTAALDSVTEWSLTALLAESSLSADRAIEELLAAGLLTVHEIDDAGQPRYRLHGLVREFALEVAEKDADAQERRMASRRLVSAAKDQVLTAGKDLVRPGHAASPDMSPCGRSWLAAEHRDVIGLALDAAELGDVRGAAELAACLTPFLTVYERRDDALRLLDDIADAAVRWRDVSVATWMRLLRAEIDADDGNTFQEHLTPAHVTRAEGAAGPDEPGGLPR